MSECIVTDRSRWEQHPMTSRERLLTALDHREPDRVPHDLASTQVTGIAIGAALSLRRHLGLRERAPDICDVIQQICIPHEDVMDLLAVDTRGLFPLCHSNLPVPVGGAKWAELHQDAGCARRGRLVPSVTGPHVTTRTLFMLPWSLVTRSAFPGSAPHTPSMMNLYSCRPLGSISVAR